VVIAPDIVDGDKIAASWPEDHRSMRLIMPEGQGASDDYGFV
jgi:hypothetical protein